MRIYQSSRPNVELPNIDLLTLLFDSKWCFAKEETKIHVEAANPKNFVTKAGARDIVGKLAGLLRQRYGIGTQGPGKDVVLTVSSGNPFIPVVFYSIVAAGGIFTGASTAFRVSELVTQIKGCAASLLICTEEHRGLMKLAAAEIGISQERILILDWKTPHHWTLRTTDRVNVLKEQGVQLDWPRITSQEELQNITICLLYSSGTTGLPKGVRISHQGLVANALCTMDVASRYRERKRKAGQVFIFDTIAHLPMANIAGISLYSVNPFQQGGTTYWMEQYDFDLFIEYHRRYRPAYQFTVPPIWLRIAKSEKVTDHFNGLQVAVTGSAPIGYATMKEVAEKLGNADISQTWGITECSGVVTALDWYVDDKTFSVGEPCPNVKLRVVDEDDNDVEPGKPGEMLVSGPILAQEYHKNPKATAETFVDGWYRTGDIGIYKDGLVYIVDRKKELIKYKGSQVAPAEIEAILTSHSRIADAAVIGVWSSELETELPRGYVVRKSSITESEVVDFVKQNLASHKQLRGGVVFVDEIPKSASGKILRKNLRLIAEEAMKAKL